MDPYLGEIRIFGFTYAPVGWATCDGQLIAISQNTALFSLLGTAYGGDGRTNFALPNLQGMVPVHFGQGSGLSEYELGETGGETSVTLLENELPGHTHQAFAHSGGRGSEAVSTPANGSALSVSQGGAAYAGGTVSPADMFVGQVEIAGGGLPHNNMMPTLGLIFCIALAGIFPPRS